MKVILITITITITIKITEKMIISGKLIITRTAMREQQK